MPHYTSGTIKPRARPIPIVRLRYPYVKRYRVFFQPRRCSERRAIIISLISPASCITRPDSSNGDGNGAGDGGSVGSGDGGGGGSGGGPQRLRLDWPYPVSRSGAAVVPHRTAPHRDKLPAELR